MFESLPVFMQVLYHCFATFTERISSSRNSNFNMSGKSLIFVNFRKHKFANKLKTYPRLFVCSLHQMRLAFARDSHQAEVYAISANCRMHIHKSPRTDPRRRSCSLLSSYLFNIVKKTTSISLKLFHSRRVFNFENFTKVFAFLRWTAW